jgi:hypothetical protein
MYRLCRKRKAIVRSNPEGIPMPIFTSFASLLSCHFRRFETCEEVARRSFAPEVCYVRARSHCIRSGAMRASSQAVPMSSNDDLTPKHLWRPSRWSKDCPLLPSGAHVCLGCALLDHSHLSTSKISWKEPKSASSRRIEGICFNLGPQYRIQSLGTSI